MFSNAVAPPQDLQITDPGLLGSLDIEWKPPPNIQTSNGCTVKYKCEYRNAGDREWKVRERTAYPPRLLLLLYFLQRFLYAFKAQAGLVKQHFQVPSRRITAWKCLLKRSVLCNSSAAAVMVGKGLFLSEVCCLLPKIIYQHPVSSLVIKDAVCFRKSLFIRS